MKLFFVCTRSLAAAITISCTMNQGMDQCGLLKHRAIFEILKNPTVPILNTSKDISQAELITILQECIRGEILLHALRKDLNIQSQAEQKQDDERANGWLILANALTHPTLSRETIRAVTKSLPQLGQDLLIILQTTRQLHQSTFGTASFVSKNQLKAMELKSKKRSTKDR